MKQIILGFLFYAIGVACLVTSGSEFWLGLTAFVMIAIGGKYEDRGVRSLK